MKKATQFLALILSVAMLMTFMAACGGKKEASDTKTETQAETQAATAGEVQTWGELSVFVPESMEMKGGDGTFAPDDPKVLWLYNKEKATDYIKVSIVDSEDNAKSNVDTTKSINEQYNPEDAAVTVGNTEWKGVAYDVNGIPVFSLYAVAGDKVYFIMSAGYKYDSEIITTVLDSLK